MSESQFTTVHGLACHYHDAGPREAESLVFIHALGCDLHLWDKVATALAATYRTIGYDLRGHGLSDCGSGVATLDDFSGDLDALLAQLAPRPVALVGISLGGLIALATALRSPERVRCLVLCTTAARIGSRESWTERIAAISQRGMEPTADAILARWFSPDFATRSPAVVRGYRNRLTRTPAAGYIAACAALRDTDLGSQLGTIGAPTLVLSGEHDLATPPDIGRALATALPQAQFAVLTGTAHLPPVEQPAAVTTAIHQFLATI